MMDQYYLHVLKENDWNRWRSLRLEALAESPYAFRSTLAEWSGVNDREERWRKIVAECGIALICEVESIPAGMIAATQPKNNRVGLTSMWVAPRFRGFGVGDKLVAGILDWANKNDVTHVSLWVREINYAALKLYRRNGFIPSGKSSYENPDSPVIEMVHTLMK